MALNNVPLSGQTLNTTRVPINQNFATIDAAFQIDHEDYNTTNQGMHNRVSFLTQNPVPAPMAGKIQLYSQLSTVTNQPELVFAHQSGSTAPLAAQIVEFTSAGWGNPGWTRLPSGILFKWHSGINFAGIATLTIDLDADVPGSPNFSQIFAVFTSTESITPYNNVLDVTAIALNDVTFAVNSPNLPPAGYTMAYLAIGI